MKGLTIEQHKYVISELKKELKKYDRKKNKWFCYGCELRRIIRVSETEIKKLKKQEAGK